MPRTLRIAFFVVLGMGLAAAALTARARAAGSGPSAAPITITLEFPADRLQLDRSMGYDLVTLTGAGYLSAAGEPQLPADGVRVALPNGFAATGVRIIDSQWTTIPGTFSILPAQPPLPTSQASTVDPTPPNPRIYASSTLYPGDLVRLVGQTDLAGQGMAALDVTPLQYVPSEGQLRLATSITIEIEGREGYVCGDYLPAAASVATQEAYAERVRGMVVNPESVRLTAGTSLSGGRALEAGTYDYVIIAPPDFVTNFEPLAEWKTQKGVPARIVTTTWIYNSGGYPGTNEEKVRAFIIDANATWGAVYFLLGGDTSVVPTHWWVTPVDPYNIPEDTFYADFDGDWTVEVHVGRVTARYEPTVYVLVDKFLGYERRVPRTDFARRALMLGFDLDDGTTGELTKEYIATTYAPSSLALTRIYDSHSGNHRTLTLAALNDGQNVVNHIDHCAYDLIGLGSYHHNWNYSAADINASHNGDRQTLFYSVGCFPCAFDQITCIAEAWAQKSGGGGHAFIGNTRYGWYNPGNPHTLSNRYDEKFFQMLWSNGLYHQGESFTAHKNSFYPSDDTYRYIFRELSLLGDPELPIWTADPESLVVTYAPTMPVGCHAYTVHVAQVGGAPVSGARVCLWKEADVYGVALTNAAGDALFDPNPTSEGSVLITMTAHNALHDQGTIPVTGSSGVADGPSVVRGVRLLPAQPSPFAGTTTLGYDLPTSGPVTLQVYDLAGRHVRTLARETAVSPGTHRVIWDGLDTQGRPVPAGIYVCRLDAGTASITERLIRLR
jgi:hypothetical protein